MKSLRGFKYCNNYTDFLAFAKSLYGNNQPFEELWKWDDFFRAEMETDLDTGEYLSTFEDYKKILGKSPKTEQYPVIVYYAFDDRLYRSGATLIQWVDWESFPKIMKE